MCVLSLEFSDTLTYNNHGEKENAREITPTMERRHDMPIKYKIDILAALRDAGYTQNRIRNEKLIGQSYLTQIRHGELVSWKAIEMICRLLDCQPGDILEYVEEAMPDQ